MRVKFPRSAQWGACVFSFLVLLLCVAGCAGKSEARIRHYFGLTGREPIQETTIQGALLRQFPVGTSSKTVEASLATRGLGKDGKSAMWRPETNQWYVGNALCCGPYDYEEHVLSVSPMRRLTVCFDLDEQQKVKQITVSSFKYGL